MRLSFRKPATLIGPFLAAALALPTLAGAQGSAVAGLKQALEIGTAAAVKQTSAEDGYLGNPLIKIGLPDSLQSMARGLRAIGMGSKVDEFEVSMNRAAEQAAGQATEVFVAGVQQMTFSDAQSILAGGGTAATDYFERTTRDELRKRFQPIVDQQMDSVGVVQEYDQLAERYEALPFTRSPDLDIRSYVTEKSLDGLFTVLGQQEQKIRADPAARTTSLLRQVFGSQ
jgi:hypothetical protein